MRGIGMRPGSERVRREVRKEMRTCTWAQADVKEVSEAEGVYCGF